MTHYDDWAFPDGAPELTEMYGWFGAFTRMQASDAYENGSRVVKVNSEPGDGHPDGSLGTLLGSFRARGPDGDERICYFVEWDASPRIAVGTTDLKVRRAMLS